MNDHPRVDFYEDGDPHVEPHLFIEHLCARRGITLDQIGVRPAVLGTFSARLTSYLADRTGASPAEHWIRDGSPAFHLGQEVTIATLPIGAPAAAAQVEELIVCGMRSLIVTGAAGSLQPRAPVGTVVLPTSAIREEGTSHHYSPSPEPALPALRVQALLQESLQARGVQFVTGPTWTTDAVYREHRSKIERYRAAGVVTVEMELSALLTVAAFRGIECAGLFVVSDELHGDRWDLGFGGEVFLDAMARASMIALDAARRSHHPEP